MKFDKVTKQYGIDKMSLGALSARRESALLLSKSNLHGAGARAHYRAVVAACDHYLKQMETE